MANAAGVTDQVRKCEDRTVCGKKTVKEMRATTCYLFSYEERGAFVYMVMELGQVKFMIESNIV